MRNWGRIVTGFYIFLIATLSPSVFAIVLDDPGPLARILGDIYTSIYSWGFIVLWAGGPLLLLFLHVDPGFRSRRRCHVAISAIAAGLAVALLLGAALLNVLTATKLLDTIARVDPLGGITIIIAWIGVWVIWAVMLYWFADHAFDPTRRLYRWLIAGSVLELLIAVPTHIVVRNRRECTEPLVTSFGVATGLSILLMSVGPAVLLLYRARARKTYTAQE